MSQQLQVSLRGICKNIYCHKPLTGFDVGKDFCINCRNKSWNEIRWLCEECHSTLLSSTTDNLTKKICNGCLASHTRKRNRRSYLRRAYKFTPREQLMVNQNIIDRKFRLFIGMFEFPLYCKYCEEPMEKTSGRRTKEYCSSSCKIAHHKRMDRFIRHSLKTLKRMELMGSW